MTKGNPLVVVIAGPNGAGKSTLAPVLLRDTYGLLEFVNADTISAGLSAFNAEAVALDAGRVMLNRLRELAAHKQNFAFESTLSGTGGHFVSEEIIRRRYERGLSNLFELYLPLAKTWAVYDNSGAGSPLLIASGDKNRATAVAEPELWRTLTRREQ